MNNFFLILGNKKLWIQLVLATSATESDLIQLPKNLAKILFPKKTRHTGICSYRERLYAQCFNELIRQITIEIKMTIQAYQALYESFICLWYNKKNGNEK